MFGLEKLFGSSDKKEEGAPQMEDNMGGEEMSMGSTENNEDGKAGL